MIDDADVCVIGAGQSGIASALRMAELGLKVVLVDSGNELFDEAIQGLSDAEILTPEHHAPMEDAVMRVLGGTSRLWGGRCVPIDRIDFEPRPHVPKSGWPLEYDDLDRYHTAASRFLAAGNASFTVDACAALPTRTKRLSEHFAPNDEVIATTIERWSGVPNAWKAHHQRVKEHKNVTLIAGHTCVGFSHGSSGGAVSAAKLVNSLNPQEARSIRAKYFVLAIGGVESTRLILNACLPADGLKLDGMAHVGRYYMGHPSGKIADIQLSGNSRETLYDFENDGETYIRRRVTFTDEFAREQQLINIAFWLDNPPPADPTHGSGVLSAAYLALTTPLLAPKLGPAAIRKRLVGTAPVRRWPHIRNCLGQPIRTVRFCIGFVYRRYVRNPRVPGFFTASNSNLYALHFHAEQRPNAESRITLSEHRDALGQRRAQIALRWLRDDIAAVVRAHETLDQLLRKHGIGNLRWRYEPGELAAAVEAQSVDGFHQLGTLRMAKSPELGVTDPVGRFFGTTNLYAASSALFPTAGQANPTLTTVALALRQAEHIASMAEPV